MTSHEEQTPSLTRALGRVNIVGIAIALLISSAGLLAYQALSLRAALLADARLQAAMVSANITASLMFHDDQTTREILRPLSNVPYVESVAVFNAQGSVHARYARAGISAPEANEATLASNFAPEHFSLKDIFVAYPVIQGGEVLGTVVLVASTEGMVRELWQYAGFLLAACICALCVSSIVTSRMKARVVKAERELEYLARTDPLTDLPNRRAFYDELAARLLPWGGGWTHVTLVLVDLDNFKTVNDTLGHGAGDELLRSVASALRDAVRPTDVVSRIGGDEFAVLAVDDADRAGSRSTAECITNVLARPFELHGGSVPVTASVGFSRFPDDATDVASLVSSADLALYAAKSGGKNVAVEFRPQMTKEAQRRAWLERELRGAIECEALELAYQPQFNCQTGQLVGVEALARWTHSSEGSISPAEFIPIAENSDLIVTLGRWVMRRACHDAAQWNANASNAASVSVNVSARQLRQPGFQHDVLEALKDSGLPPGMLELELTESLLMANMSVAVNVMRQLRAHGIRLSIDDFGTGYSSLSYLQSFPLNQIKIDRGFVKALPHAGQPIVTAIISMAHSFGLTVVAEGVEYPAQLAWLSEAGCDVVQGFLTGRPMSFAGIAEAMRESDGAAVVSESG
ncbi:MULTISPECIES: bifunctional diguanylate cyclase/phosphodiesterase [Paraburkholderia]|jgi:diguanylate cyclase (GGDEF)-like protein|uniref:EAL domain-containing protein n=1 Tax=Paraburkholderia madseniana TaxID=2599607 RepID=A0A6N6WDX5_9BURK|nr:MULTISPECIES: EAL domain-containing protein [Paraburkholderia]KAE8758713.1 EAL domain-containing protein [Paraburkholderia madseniana]MCX4170721.1 EAL domain-containing protein [Paraburkholderia madseniana]MDQ6458733.1 EAL domain-containing protein [Paraburkholderia madseniana]NPT65048.1 EAL domain-containing protein [Paraburkholderia madseniana]